jgi:hypothetical protein
MSAVVTESITAILAFIAVILSTLSLWFTSLRGPDIVLCNKPEFTLQKIPRQTFERIVPDDLSCSGDLFFLNKGTVSGVLTLEARFEPANWLKPFFQSSRFSFKIDGTQHEKSMPPMPIREKESSVICINLYVELHNWKKYFEHAPVSEDEMPKVLCDADKENKLRFHGFCAKLEPSMPIGTIGIKSYQTMRRNLFGTNIDYKDLIIDQNVGVISKELVDGFRSCDERWDTLEPDAVLMKLREIHRSLEDVVYKPIEHNMKKLMGIVEGRTLNTGLFDELTSKCEGYDSRMAMVHFVLRSANLESRLVEYDSRTREWNRKFDLLQENQSNKALEEAVNKEKIFLEEESGLIAVELNKVQAILQDCYLSRPLGT